MLVISNLDTDLSKPSIVCSESRKRTARSFKITKISSRRFCGRNIYFMKLGFICLNLPGHLNPMTALARRLQDRNQDVVFLYSSGAAGLPFVPGPEKDHLNESRPDLSK